MAADTDHVWGTGSNPYWDDGKYPTHLSLHAVRGRLTARKLWMHNISAGDAVLGEVTLHIFDQSQVGMARGRIVAHQPRDPVELGFEVRHALLSRAQSLASSLSL